MGKIPSNLLEVTLLWAGRLHRFPSSAILWFCSSDCRANGRGALCCSSEKVKEAALSSSVVAWGSQVKHFPVAVRPVLGASLSLPDLSFLCGSWLWRDLQSCQGASWVKQIRKDSVTKGKPLNHPCFRKLFAVYYWQTLTVCHSVQF